MDRSRFRIGSADYVKATDVFLQAVNLAASALRVPIEDRSSRREGSAEVHLTVESTSGMRRSHRKHVWRVPFCRG